MITIKDSKLYQSAVERREEAELLVESLIIGTEEYCEADRTASQAHAEVGRIEKMWHRHYVSQTKNKPTGNR